ncbi:MAG: hypothetical protein ACI9K2_006985 [Myxococcota bacterium]
MPSYAANPVSPWAEVTSAARSGIHSAHPGRPRDPEALGWTDCARLDAGIYGTIDPRRLLHTPDDPLGFGLGALVPEVEFPLRDGVVSAGGDWSADWEPFVFGAYIVVDGMVAATGHALSYGHTCGAPDDVALPVPALPVGDRFIRTGTEYLLVVD